VRHHLATAASTLVLLAFASGPSHAQSVADFYKGKNLTMEIGYSVGGGYDIYARLVARFLGRHVPGNPTVVTKNMPGAGSLRLANWLYSAAPKDGTEIGTIGRGIPFDPLLGSPQADFDPLKFTWLGSANNEVSICAAWHTSGIKKLEELYTKSMIVGGTGGGADTDVFPEILNGVLQTKIRIVSGYPGGNDINIAMERGEVDGRCGWSWSSVVATHSHWLTQSKINVLVQLSLSKHADLAHVPLIEEFAKTAEDKQILKLIFARQVMGRPFLAPPGLPADRAAALQQAFVATMKDKDFLAEAEKMKLEINPVSAAEVEQVLREAYQVPKEVAVRAGKLANATN
jgi:tripartite-type tricarboxylate transporter receptor subunit TctC